MYEDLLGLPPPWHGLALCAEVDGEVFFPPKGESPEPAKRICNLCEARPECLQHALDHSEPYGVWGGLTDRERRRLTRKQVRQGQRMPDADRVARIRRMAGAGMIDREIAAEEGGTADGIGAFRRRHGIAPGRGRGAVVAGAGRRAGAWNGIR